jgi:hypothetical protein
LALAARLGNPENADAVEIATFEQIPAFRPDQWGVARLVALRLTDKHAASAVALWTTLLRDLPPDLKAKWLEDAIRAARAAKDDPRAADWEEQKR